MRSIRALLEDSSTNGFLCEDQHCLTLETGRSADSMNALADLVVRAAHDVLNVSVLFVTTVVPAMPGGTRLFHHRGFWGALERDSDDAYVAERGQSLWIPPTDDPRGQGLYAGMGAVDIDALAALLSDIAKAQRSAVVLGLPEVAHDPDVVARLATLLPATTTAEWQRFSTVALAAGLLPLRCYGAFDDQESAVQIFGPADRLRIVEAALRAAGLVSPDTPR